MTQLGAGTLLSLSPPPPFPAWNTDMMAEFQQPFCYPEQRDGRCLISDECMERDPPALISYFLTFSCDRINNKFVSVIAIEILSLIAECNF